ncbi:hypothetical protein GIB67_001375 [Kingdonia uniflora]|uniref:Uncharacterized protein n=1 Tax=Kingdonia uniflora TaxID=39325 RepID=A0A7J7N7D8_9MAGN|nr:hypothetical protein GIB67_001375 [Kingdonia uniflora]
MTLFGSSLSALVVVVVVVVVLLFFNLELCISTPTSDLFSSWCTQHGKSYSSEEEKLYRLKVFEDNLNFVKQHNTRLNSTYTLSLNMFSDLTHYEFKASRFGLSSSPVVKSILQVPKEGVTVSDIPASIDWRSKGAVTAVKDQASCGACWAFSSTGAIEGINQIVTGSLVSLSEQELVDCDKSYNNGCNGGLMDYAFEWTIKNQGIDTEKDYPYQAGDRTCNKNKAYI